jgi:hypothetical protein
MWHELNWCAPAAFVVVAYPILYTAVGAAVHSGTVGAAVQRRFLGGVAGAVAVL